MCRYVYGLLRPMPPSVLKKTSSAWKLTMLEMLPWYSSMYWIPREPDPSKGINKPRGVKTGVGFVQCEGSGEVVKASQGRTSEHGRANDEGKMQGEDAVPKTVMN